MGIIDKNPFKIIGVRPIDSEKDILKQLTKIKRFSEVGKDVSFDMDLPHLGELIRNSESISEAKRKIEKSDDKLFHSLFWFNIDNHIDETGFESLKNKNENKTLEIWRKVVKDGNVSPKNYSTLSNLKSLLLILSFQNNFNKDYLNEAMNLSGLFFSNSEFKNYYKKIIPGESVFDSNQIQKKFIDSIHLKLKSDKLKISTKEFLNTIVSFPDSIKEEYKNKISNSPINKIETEVSNVSQLRDENPSQSLKYAESLLGLADELDSLAKITDPSDVKYQLIADKYAKEILECTISFYNDKINTGIIIREEAEIISELLEVSEDIACGEQLRKRIEENKEVILESTENSPPGSKITKRIEKSYLFIKTKIYSAATSLNTGNTTSIMCTILLEDCRDKLLEIGEKLGSEDEFYIDISSQFVQVQIALQIDYLNRHMKYSKLTKSQIQLFESLGTFAMDSSTRTRYITNKNILKGNYNQTSGGCYIATMAYGDYDHPSVMELRGFRDNYLKKSYLGRGFIEIYYKYSPRLVMLLKNKKTINLLIRNMLNRIVLIIKYLK